VAHGKIRILEVKSGILRCEQDEFLGEMPVLEPGELGLDDGHSDSAEAWAQTGAFESRPRVMRDGAMAEAVTTPVMAARDERRGCGRGRHNARHGRA
jgi:hypothetical protein